MSRRHKRVELVIGLLLVVALAIGYLAVLGVYESEASKRSKATMIEESNAKHRLDIFAKIQNVDPNKGEMSLRLEFFAHGSVALEESELIPAVDIVIYTPGSSGKQEHELKAGRLMGGIELVLPLEGLASDYPFDEHKAALAIVAFAKAPSGTQTPDPAGQSQGDEGASGEADTSEEAKSRGSGSEENALATSSSTSADDPLAGLQELPISVALYAALPNVDMAIDLSGTSGSADPNIAEAIITIHRAITIVGFAVFVMVIFWVIAIAIVLQAVAIASRGREPEPDTMGYMAALLFAFPFMRDALPGTPPVGTLSDFLSFFWAEALVAIALIATLISWLRRPTGRPKWWRPDGEGYGDTALNEMAPQDGAMPESSVVSRTP